jgi:hypothetical protein
MWPERTRKRWRRQGFRIYCLRPRAYARFFRRMEGVFKRAWLRVAIGNGYGVWKYAYYVKWGYIQVPPGWCIRIAYGDGNRAVAAVNKFQLRP